LEAQVTKWKENIVRVKSLKIGEASDTQSAMSGMQVNTTIPGSSNNMHSPILDSFKEKEYLQKIEQLNEILNENQSDIDLYVQQIDV
jgi:hypothetical protein